MAHFGKPTSYPRTILICDPAQFILAMKAATWLIGKPEQKSGILAFGDNEQTVFYVKRNKSSIAVTQANPGTKP
jgi:hypothetical protein